MVITGKKTKGKENKVKKLVIQHHHIDYDKPEFTIPIYKGEHWQITKLDRKFRLSKHKPFSKGMLYALHCLYLKYWDKGVDIEDFFKTLLL